MGKILVILVSVTLLGASYDAGRFPIEVEDIADGITDSVLGWNGSGGAISQTRHGVRAGHGSSQSIANATNTILALNGESFDDDDMHDTVTLNSRLTATAAGRYFINGQVRWQNNGTGLRITDILVNGTTLISRVQDQANSSGAEVQTTTALYDLALNDYVELRVSQTSGGSLNVEFITDHSPFLMMQQVRN